MNQPVLFIIPGACALGSQITLEWIGIPYQIGLTTPEIRASREFRQVNPSGKVGALKDGDQVVAENLAILLYLADKYRDNGIAPAAGTPDRAKVYQWLSYLSSTLHPAFGQANFPGRFVGPEYTDEFRQLAIKRLTDTLEFVNSNFNSHGFFVSDKPTVVEAQAYGLLRWANGFHGSAPIINIQNFPQIVAFISRMEHDQAVKNALLIEKAQAELAVNSKFGGYFSF